MQREIIHYIPILSSFIVLVAVTFTQVQLHPRKQILHLYLEQFYLENSFQFLVNYRRKMGAVLKINKSKGSKVAELTYKVKCFV